MTQYFSVNVKLSNSQLRKLKSAIRNFDKLKSATKNDKKQL